MKRQSFIVEEGHGCPFRVEALRFFPTQSYDDGLTLLFLHAFGLHKETFNLLISHLVNQIPLACIKDVWVIDNPNHGRSAVLNHELLKSVEYQEKWSVSEYAKAVFSFLSSTSHGVDFSRRRLVGLGHSGGANALMLLKKIHPEITFEGFIFLDPGLLPPKCEYSYKLVKWFRETALSKRESWSNREEARKALSTRGSYCNFLPAALESFLDYAVLPLDESGRVTLACSKAYEAAVYAQDDIVDPPSEEFLALQKEHQLSVHLIICLEDEYRRKSKEMKDFQMATVSKMNNGYIQIMEKGGHMFPQAEPELSAIHINSALMTIDNRRTRARL